MKFSLENEILWSEIAYPKFQLLEERIESFTNLWPISLNQNGTMLSKAGFFYTGRSDIVTCYFCGLNLYRWLSNDIPINEHTKFNKNCGYISLFQKNTYSLTRFECSTNDHISYLITKVKSMFESFLQFLRKFFYLVSNKFSQDFLNNVNAVYRCKICLNEDSNILLLPCSHICTCISCTTCVNLCPICRCKIKSVIKVYFS